MGRVTDDEILDWQVAEFLRERVLRKQIKMKDLEAQSGIPKERIIELLDGIDPRPSITTKENAILSHILGYDQSYMKRIATVILN